MKSGLNRINRVARSRIRKLMAQLVRDERILLNDNGGEELRGANLIIPYRAPRREDV